MSLFIRTDVTAVKLHKNFVLAGIGSFVNVFDKVSTKLIHRIHALQGQKIYGLVISECGRKILVFGGKQFTILSIEESNAGVIFSRSFYAVVCDDWIHSGLWTDQNTVAFLTAHNVVQKWNITEKAQISQHQSKDNSILYSGLLLPLLGDMLVFAGTVFSEVTIHGCCDEKPLHRLKGHRGVIFSISCAPEHGIIVTTSDDRSVRMWKVNNSLNHAYNTIEYWENANIICKHEMYGHTARVMKSCITSDNIVSVGEDATICFWDFLGNLLKKVVSHQNASIWSVDHDKQHIVTGGGDSGILLHPLTLAIDHGNNETLDLDVGTPKKLLFTARRNIVVLNEEDLVFFDAATKSKMIYKLHHESSYKLLSVSSCKQIVAVADMYGKLDVFVETCKDTAYLQNIISTKLKIGKILSMQWAGNRHLVFCSENGTITVLASKGNTTEVYANFVLPASKERWLTASAIDPSSKTFVVGDRCGNIHIYDKDLREPIKTFTKVHGRYGPTSLTIKNNEIVTTGRDGTIKYFSTNHDLTEIKYMHSQEMEFQWVEKFLDKNENMICGFQERIFVVYDVKANNKLLQVHCGGGHRSWDAIRYFDKLNDEFEECVRLIYIKNSDVHISTFELGKIVSKNIVNGSHSKEINCLKTFSSEVAKDMTYYITGGADTTLRISSIDSQLQFQNEVVFKQLSNIRTLRICSLTNNQILLVSAGGRAQICIKIITVDKTNEELKLSSQEIVDYMIKGTDKERKGNQTWRNCSIDFDPETRIMDIDLIKISETVFIVFAGCSDACLRIFKLTHDSQNCVFKPIKELKHHKTCILKTVCIKFLSKDILVTCTTRGEITLWEVSNSQDMQSFDVKPIFTTTANKSGINCFTSSILSDTHLLIAAGGDDNSIYLKILEIPDQFNLESMTVLHTWSTDKFHSSQITGLCLLDDILVTASIDQRITLCKWGVGDGGIRCRYVTQAFSDVADIQGLEVLENSSDSVTVCVFGKGIEIIRIPTSII